jgi:hypothetical protein
LNVQQENFVIALWILTKSDLDNGGTSVVKLLLIEESSFEFYNGFYHIQEHSFFDLVIAGTV